MSDYQNRQAPRPNPTNTAHRLPWFQQGLRAELITPNPKLKLLDQVREVMRLKHYSLGTETCYSDCDTERKIAFFPRMH